MGRKEKRERQVPEVELDVIEAALSFGEVAISSLEQVNRANSISELAVDTAERAFKISEFYRAELAKNPNLGVLSSQQLESAAKRFPQWKVSSGFNDGKPVKAFTRHLDDLAPGVAESDDTYRRFADPEYFDWDLLQIFESYTGTGSFGTFNSFTIYAETPGPVTISDVISMAKAEDYLLEEGLIVPPTNESTAEAI